MEEYKASQDHFKKHLPNYFYGHEGKHLNNPGGIATEKALRDLNTSKTKYIDQLTSLNQKKQFSVDPNTSKPFGKKKSSK